MKPFSYHAKWKRIFRKQHIEHYKKSCFYSSVADKNAIPTIDMTSVRRGTPKFEQLENHFKENFVVKKKPVILRGLANDWSAVSNWNKTSKYVRNKYGKKTVQIQFSQNGIYDQTNFKGEMEYSAISSMTIEDFWKEYVDKKVPRNDYAYITEGSSSITKKEEKIENHKQKSKSSIGQYRDILIDAMGNSLGNKESYEQPFFDDPEFDCSQHMTKSLLWIAAGDAVAAPHRDLYHNFNVCISGAKEYYLLPPKFFREAQDFPRISYRLKRMDTTGNRYKKILIASDSGEAMLTRGFSSLNFKSLYEEIVNTPTYRFHEDLFAPMKGTCFPGDVLYMPYNFYHHVFSTSDNENKSIAFNFWQTCLFGVDIDSDDSAKNLEKNIMKNAVALENLKRIREFEERAYD